MSSVHLRAVVMSRATAFGRWSARSAIAVEWPVSGANPLAVVTLSRACSDEWLVS